MNKIYLALIALVIACGCIQNNSQAYMNEETAPTTSTIEPFDTLPPTNVSENALTIGTFELSKTAELAPFYLDKIKLNDITVVTKPDGRFEDFCNLLPEYECYMSEDTNYGVLFKNAQIVKVTPIAISAFETNPLWITFSSNGKIFNLITVREVINNIYIEPSVLTETFSNPAFNNDTIVMSDNVVWSRPENKTIAKYTIHSITMNGAVFRN